MEFRAIAYGDKEHDICGKTTIAVLEVGGGIDVPLCQNCVEELTEQLSQFNNTIFCHKCNNFKMDEYGWNYGGRCSRHGKDVGCMDTCIAATPIEVDSEVPDNSISDSSNDKPQDAVEVEHICTYFVSFAYKKCDMMGYDSGVVYINDPTNDERMFKSMSQQLMSNHGYDDLVILNFIHLQTDVKLSQSVEPHTWKTSTNPKDFVSGDIIVNGKDQSNKRLVVYADNVAIWVTELVQCALTNGIEKDHPIYPMYFNEMQVWEPFTRIGNIRDFDMFIESVGRKEVLHYIGTMGDSYTKQEKYLKERQQLQIENEKLRAERSSSMTIERDVDSTSTINY